MTIYYLYVKTHRITGLNYLGQTRQNPYTYSGSGIYWKNHLAAHGKEHDTKIIKECHTKENIKVWGEHYSKLWNVVESKDWANLKPENGEGGAYFGHRMSAETKALQTVKAKQRQKHTCLHCGVTCSICHFKRWHGDNCKLVLAPEVLKERVALSRVQQIYCLYCGKTVLPSRFNQLHGDRCSKNPANIAIKLAKHKTRIEERTIYTCVYCSSSTKSKTNYLRWHGTNCKNKP